MSDAHPQLRLLLDEDLSPKVAQHLREEDGVDAVALRDRASLGATDREVLDLAFDEDRVLVTANVGDFRRLAAARELHGGIVLLEDGRLVRDEQLSVVRHAIAAISAELISGRDMVNRVLAVDHDRSLSFENMPADRQP